MTSTASPPNNIPAQNSSASTATSYASAAGAPKKQTSTPLSAAGSNPPPVVVGSSAPGTQQQQQHAAKPTSASPVNGRPAITPALPAPVTPMPAVTHNSAANGHERKGSVTISATAPSSYIATNGGTVGGPKGNIQFGYKDSPAVAHSTPQQGGSAPIPIPGSSSARVPSPAHSPSPIPQPSASGGRPPSMSAQDGGPSMRFGSLGADGEQRHNKHLSQPAHGIATGSPHMRHGSTHSVHDNMGSHGGHGNHQGQQGSGRGGFGGGRGRGNYNNATNYSAPMGYPPGQYGRGGGPGRGGMGNYQSPRMATYQGSPQPHRSTPVMPAPGTPNMNQQLPTHPPQASYGAYMPPPYPANVNTYGSFPSAAYAPGQQQPMMGMGAPYYPQIPAMQPMPYMAPGQAPGPGYQPAYPSAQFAPPPAAQPMSRNPSQVSERPNSSTGLSQASAVVPGSAPLAHGAGVNNKPAVVSSGGNPSFVIPKKATKAITIKNPQGEAVDLTTFKAPASPAPSTQQSKTPPLVSSTPPPKPGTPAHGHARSDSTAMSKTAEQLRNEFKEQVRKTAEAPSTGSKETKEPGADSADEQPTGKAEAAVEPEALAEPKTSKPAEAAKSEQATAAVSVSVEVSAAPVASSTSTPALPADDEAGTASEKKSASTGAQKEVESKQAEKVVDEEDDIERMIREMEELEATREQEEAEYARKKKADADEKKRQEEANRASNAAENDRKLREQEREMERLEEERERKRNEAVAKGGKSVAEALADKAAVSDDTSTKQTPTPNVVADKLSTLSIRSGSPSSGAVAPGPKSGGSEKLRAKPAALNLAPLNTKPVEPPQPSAALQSLKSARFIEALKPDLYPAGINSPNPALNTAVQRKGKSFKYDANFLLQFRKVFTEQPSMEFGQQVKSLIGDGDGGRSASARTPAPGSARQNSRAGGAPGGFTGAMGMFGAGGTAGGASKLPPGTTSEERFKLSNARPGAAGIMGGMGSFPRPFPGGPAMNRQPSSSGMGGMGGSGIPNSPRQSSRSTRNNSKPRPDHKADKSMPLTQGLELKPITVSATGWKPSSLGARGPAGAAAQQPGLMDPEMVQRKVKAALNKMTPEKFDKLAEQILAIAAQSKDEQDGRTLRQVIQLTFEKATDEAHWASMYAKFCKRMLETMSPEIRDVSIVDKHGVVVSGGALFRKYLLNRCQEEFERGWKLEQKAEDDKTERDGEPDAGENADTADKDKAADKDKDGKDKKAGEAEMLSDEYYVAAAAKRRGLGLVQFIGELYKLGMLTERIMHQCVQKLVDYRGVPDEAEIESLSKLLRTIGGNLDVNTEKTQGKHMMDAYFQRIQSAISMPELPSRLKFMLMDIVDLRAAGWYSKEANKGPKTLDEVRAEAEAAAAAKAAENARSSHQQRGMPGGRPPMGGRGGDGRGLSGYGPPAPNQNQIGMDDLRRLKGSASRTTSQSTTFGPSSMFASRSNSGRARLGAGSAFSRGGEDSNASSRTGTPPTRESASHSNAFSLLANMETENPASPPSTAASPALSKAVPDNTSAAGK